VSAVLAAARKEIWQGLVGAFNVRLTDAARKTDRLGLLNQGATFCRLAVEENAPLHRSPVGVGHWLAGTLRGRQQNHCVSSASRSHPISLPVRGWRLASASSCQVHADPRRNRPSAKAPPGSAGRGFVVTARVAAWADG